MNAVYSTYNQIILESYVESHKDLINESYELYRKHLISEAVFIDKIVSFFKGIGNLISSSWDGLKKCCEKIFDYLPVQELMQYAGINKEALFAFSKLLKGCFILYPAVKLSVEAHKSTIVEINGEDFALLVDKERLGKVSKKFFKDNNFFVKAGKYLGKFSKNLAIEIVKNFPMIIKCIIGYSLTDAFENALDKDSAIKKAGEKIGNEMARIPGKITGKEIYSATRIGKNYEDALAATEEAAEKVWKENGDSKGLLDMHALSVAKKQAYYKGEDGKLHQVGGSYRDYDPNLNPNARFNLDGSPRKDSEMPSFSLQQIPVASDVSIGDPFMY